MEKSAEETRAHWLGRCGSLIVHTWNIVVSNPDSPRGGSGYETRNNGALNGISSSSAYIASSGTKTIFARIGFGSGVNTAPSAAYKFSL